MAVIIVKTVINLSIFSFFLRVCGGTVGGIACFYLQMNFNWCFRKERKKPSKHF